ncbi:alpha carbonic anhydrase 7-like [Euphorbia lathyris]|uniref:alpha carbonic anhydrase 7-like n=1 Tax=Euphorbia lathyris TaxID=212925 RepID=UPI0033133BBE
MKNQTPYIFFSATTALIVLFSHSASVSAHVEVEDERDFDYIRGSEKGPEKWGKLKKEWSSCNNGSLQSPVDMSNQRVKIIRNAGNWRRNYKPSNSTVKNRGHDISVQWEGKEAGSIYINGTQYFLQQCHWHSPSEHTINGRRYEMELHMVHENTDPNVKNKIAVVGLLYKIGQPDSFLSKLLNDVNLGSMINHEQGKNMGMVDPRNIKMDGKKYYRYLGSLTVPPCTEGVIWTINNKIRTVSKGQVKALREAVHDYAEQNARPVQPLNRREIQLHA